MNGAWTRGSHARNGRPAAGLSLQILALLAFIFLGLVLAHPAQAQSRYALVIGVDRYERAPTLRNPSNDARDLAARLSALDYTLIGGGAQINTTRDQMLDHLDTLATRARAGDTVLVFFAGHGSFMGEGDSAETYLIPTDDARLTYREDLADRAVGLSAIMRRIQASGAAGVVIIDACRDLPLPSRVGGRSMSRGLAPPRSQAASGLFIAYAADVGQIASDGTGRNSPFTQALLQALQNPARRVEDVFFDVRRAVLDLSQGRQTPLVQSYLDAPLFLVSSDAAMNGLTTAGQHSMAVTSTTAFANSCEYNIFINIFPESRSNRRVNEIASSCTMDFNSIAESSLEHIRTSTLINICDLGLGGACLAAAHRFETGLSNQQDLPRAVGLLEQGCSLEHAESCTRVGWMHENGRGAPRNDQLALDFYTTACGMGEPRACYNLAWLYQYGRGTRRDRSRARELYRRACSLGLNEACGPL